MQRTSLIYPTIYFLTVVLNKAVHMQALGFTTQFYQYACAGSIEEAQAVVEQWATQQGCDVKSVHASPKPASQQDVHTYAFPHQIINLPKEVLDSLYERRGYPDEWKTPGRYIEVKSIASSLDERAKSTEGP
ncbi:hypothetical protein LPN04_31280 [Rugamonas sp. A1-17]|nr:hypothetical protein [Rugamonas sp. A1-17]